MITHPLLLVFSLFVFLTSATLFILFADVCLMARKLLNEPAKGREQAVKPTPALPTTSSQRPTALTRTNTPTDAGSDQPAEEENDLRGEWIMRRLIRPYLFVRYGLRSGLTPPHGGQTTKLGALRYRWRWFCWAIENDLYHVSGLSTEWRKHIETQLD